MVCEHTGKTALAREVSGWMIEAMGLRLVRWHNHFVAPQRDAHMIVRAEGDATAVGREGADLNTAEDEEQIMSLRPSVLEQLQRHNIWRHLHPDIFRDDDVLFINHYYADAVYAPLYYGYGEPGSFSDRSGRARAWDRELLEIAPDTVLVQVKAEPEVVRRRMRQAQRLRSVLREEDVELVLEGFQREYDSSLVPRRFTLDTTSATVQDTLTEFLDQLWPHLSQVDRLRLASLR